MCAKSYSDSFRFNIFIVRCLGGYFFPDSVYTLCPKKIPNIFNCNVKKDYQILIIGTNISEKAGQQTAIHFPTSFNICFCTTWGNRNQWNTVITFLCNAVWLLNQH